MNELEQLQEKYKKKCAALKEARRIIKDYDCLYKQNIVPDHIQYLQKKILNKIISTHPRNFYDIKYEFLNGPVTIKNFLSYGVDYMVTEVAIYLSRQLQEEVRDEQITIISAKRLS